VKGVRFCSKGGLARLVKLSPTTGRPIQDVEDIGRSRVDFPGLLMDVLEVLELLPSTEAHASRR